MDPADDDYEEEQKGEENQQQRVDIDIFNFRPPAP
jgi:hypothetical protein